MKQKGNSKSIGLIATIILVSTLFAGLAINGAGAYIVVFSEFQVTSNTGSQQNPDIYEYGSDAEYAIVYQDNRNGNWDIYLYDSRLSQPEIPITQNLANQISPKIFNDIIVWQDDRNGNWDIYMYNITSKIETQITNNSAIQINPAIDGNHIVWQDDRNGNPGIYMFDLETQTEQVIETLRHFDPAISGNRIVYIENIATNNYYLDCYDLSTGARTTLAYDWDLDGNRMAHPAIFGNRVAWMKENLVTSFLLPRWDIYMRDLTTNNRWDWRTYNEANEVYPDIYRNYIVYERYTYSRTGTQGDSHVYLYNIDIGTEYRVTNSSSLQIEPAITAEYGNYIVYMDNRNGNWDIYLSAFGYITGGPGPEPKPPPTPSLAIQKLQNIKNIIADTSQIPLNDFDGANNKVKDNRRNTLLNKLDATINTIEVAAEHHYTNYQGAINQLNSILDKTDGDALRGVPDIAGSGFTPDWITTSESQAKIQPLMASAITMLKELNESKDGGLTQIGEFLSAPHRQH